MMAKVGDIGTLKELGVCVGDVVEFNEWVDVPQVEFIGIKMTIDDKGNAFFMDEDGGKDWFYPNCQHKFRLISRASDTPKLWREMTSEEKGELLLAAHEGKVVECCNANGVWVDVIPVFSGGATYRVKPEPKVENVTNTEMYITARGCIASNGRLDDAKPVKLTYTKTDGVIDLASYKLEYR